MKCRCGEELIWGGDHDYEDFGLEGEGIVSNLSCNNKDCLIEDVSVCTKLKKEDK